MKFELTFKQKIRVVAALVAVNSLVIAGAGFFTQLQQARAMTRLEMALSAIQVHTEADMMHDDLRAEVYRALWTAGNARERSAAIAADVKRKTARLVALHRAASGIGLSEDIRALFVAATPGLDAYVESTQRIVDLAARDPEAAGRELTDFDARFRVLEVSFAGLTERVSTLAMMNTQTASAAEEQSYAADAIRQHVAKIQDVTSRTAEEADYTAGSAQDLAALAAQLTAAVSQFKLA
jgi:methyl-accepting chemotaxis protein